MVSLLIHLIFHLKFLLLFVPCVKAAQVVTSKVVRPPILSLVHCASTPTANILIPTLMATTRKDLSQAPWIVCAARLEYTEAPVSRRVFHLASLSDWLTAAVRSLLKASTSVLTSFSNCFTACFVASARASCSLDRPNTIMAAVLA